MIYSFSFSLPQKKDPSVSHSFEKGTKKKTTPAFFSPVLHQELFAR